MPGKVTTLGTNENEGKRSTLRSHMSDKLRSFDNSEHMHERMHLRLDKLHSKRLTPSFIYIITIFAALGGFLFGYDTGVISGAMILLRKEMNLSSVWQELIVSGTIASAAVFALVGGSMNDRFGRRPVIMVASIIFTVGSLMMAFSINKLFLFVGRLIVGMGIGLTSATIPVYLAECSPSHLRGTLVSTNIAMVAFGQFAASVVDGIFGRNAKNGWRFMLGLGSLPSVGQLIGFMFMPESPRWLLKRQMGNRARRSLQTLRGTADIEDEYNQIQQTCSDVSDVPHSTEWTPVIVRMLKTPALRRSLFVGCCLQVIQQFSGINTIMYYSSTIIRMSGVKSDETAIWLSAVTAAVNFLFTLIGLYLVEHFGRRPLTLGSLVGASVSLVWIAVGFYVGDLNSPPVHYVGKSLNSSRCGSYGSCRECRRDVNCGYCYVEDGNDVLNATCLLTTDGDPWTASEGPCNTRDLHGGLTWAYDFCPTTFFWIPLIGLVLYLAFFAPGMGPMPWTINSEIYPLWARSTGNAVSTFTNWTCNLIVSMTFISFTEAISRQGTFWMYACVSLIGLIILALILPETRGLNLEEVEGLFASSMLWRPKSDLAVKGQAKTVQYVHIRGLNRDGDESELESPE